MSEIRYLTAGDSAVTVEFGNEINAGINSRMKALSNNLKSNPVKGVTACVPAFRSLLVSYDPTVISYNRLIRKLKKKTEQLQSVQETKKRVIEIPVCYGEAYGEDIDDVAKHAGITKEEVIALHSGTDYLIYMLGFLPGFAYLGGLDDRLVTPRLENPRTKIPAGSVGIGGEQTGIYPLASPGGWRLIGRTPVKPYDAVREEPFLYSAGDYIRFVPVTQEQYRDIEAQVEAGVYQCRIKEGETL